MHKTKRKLAPSIAKIALIVSITIICSLFLVIPTHPIPITFQTVVAVSAGILLGKKQGAIAMSVYFFMGFICHIPIFSGFSGGFSAALKLTFGYIIGFMPAAFLSGYICEKTGYGFLHLTLAAVFGVIIDYLFGIAYFIFISRWYVGTENLLRKILIYNLVYLPKD